MKNRKKFILGIVIQLLWGATGITACGHDGDVVLLETETEECIETVATVSGSCFVYVCGQVTNPGVYEFPFGSHVCDALEASGGMTEYACSTYWNQAEELMDGEKIYVPTIEEVQALQTPAEENDLNKSNDGTEDGRVNINIASKEQLMTIPGVGESKANSILSYRKEKGNFASPEEIMNITGIKEGLFSKIKDYISVGN